MERKIDEDRDGAGFRRATDGTSDGLPEAIAELRDPGLAALRELNRAYPAALGMLEAERRGRADAELRLALLQDANVALQREMDTTTRRLETATRELQQARNATDRQRERGDHLMHVVKQMHAALYRGSTPEFVLRAAMQISHADAGVYVAAVTDDELRVRAAIDAPAAVDDAPPEFIAQIVRTVLAGGEEVCWSNGDPQGVEAAAPEPLTGAGAAVPVTIRGEPHGVIVVFDEDGRFDANDMDSLLSVGRQASVALENAHLRREVQDAFIATIAMLADTVAAKDPYTEGHCREVSRIASLAAARLGMSQEEVRVTCYAGLLHDIGKIGISDGVLNKPGPLMAEERALVEAHVRIGHDLLNNVPALRDVAAAVLHHHERFDGQGYPGGLSGDEIPLPSRIVGTVDAYCAMLDHRSYKEAMDRTAARAELMRCRGTQFDPRVVDAVLAVIDEGAPGGGTMAPECGLPPMREMHNAP